MQRERERERERFLQNLNAVNCVDYISAKHSVKKEKKKRDWEKKKSQTLFKNQNQNQVNNVLTQPYMIFFKTPPLTPIAINQAISTTLIHSS